MGSSQYKHSDHGNVVPHIRNVLIKQLSQEIHAHARIFNYMLARGLYPSYHLDQMIQNDLNNAQKVLSIPVQ
ncbi:spore coat protein [Paenibacillus sp. P26]|nr:spore coat protein [Paenibacillus sp. P26]